MFKLNLDQIVGPKGNKEFTDLITVMACNVGLKFDLEKLQFNKLIVASDGDVDGYFIRSLLMAFFFKLFPEIIEDGRLYIAEPPLYRVDDKKDPFVINKNDYIERYIKLILKDYRIGYQNKKDVSNINYLNKEDLYDFLNESSSYVDDMDTLVKHYKVNDRLLEIILEEFSDIGYENIKESIEKLNIQKLMNRISEEYSELYYDDKTNLIKGALDGKHQLLEISEQLIRKSIPLMKVIDKWKPSQKEVLLLKNNKTGTEYNLSILGILKILKKYQPNIVHRFKGLNTRPFLLNCWDLLLINRTISSEDIV